MNSRELSLVLVSLIPESKGVWKISGDDGYSGLHWKSEEITQPTEAECEAEWARMGYIPAREKGYIEEGCTDHAMIVALWEAVLENNPSAADALEVKRQEVKARNLKP